MDEKQCSICGVTKPASEFHDSRWSKDLLRRECKECRRESDRKRRRRLSDGLTLLDSLTPPEGIEAARYEVSVAECEEDAWYCLEGCWYKYIGQLESDNLFLASTAGQLHFAHRDDCEKVFPARPSADCTVGDLKPGESCFMDGAEYERLWCYERPMVPLVTTAHILVFSPPDTPCHRVPKEAE